MSNVPPQGWCGQTQPHAPHVWVKQTSTGMGLYYECGGHL